MENTAQPTIDPDLIGTESGKPEVQVPSQPTNPVVPSASQTPPASPSHSRKKLILFGLLSGVLILAIVGGVFAYMVNSNPKTPVEAQITPTIQASPTPNKSEQTKTYTDSTYGFTFKYPNNLTILKEAPQEFRYVEAGSPGFENSKMFAGCILYLYDVNAHSSIIAIDIHKRSGDGAFCWSQGEFFDHQTKTISESGDTFELSSDKWKASDHLEDDKMVSSEWRGDIFESTDINGTSYFAAVALLTSDKTMAEDEAQLGQILSTFAFTK